MKKTVITVCCIIAAVILLAVSIPLSNNLAADATMKQLTSAPLPEKTELIDSFSIAGKLVGNGNGMQHFGAILIHSELSLEELEEYYSKLRKESYEYMVEVQEGQEISNSILEHRGPHKFSAEVGSNGYYIVYSWGITHILLLIWTLEVTNRKNSKQPARAVFFA